jgi:hypothetical protein
MKFLIITFITVGTFINVHSQNRFGNSDGIKRSDMNGEFAVQFAENTNKYFIAVDLNQLNSDQRGKFETQVFDDNHIVAVSTPNDENIWYLSTLKTYIKEDVLLALFMFKEKSMISSSTTGTKYHR